MTQVRAVGDGTTVDRCIMEVYLDDKLYGERQVVTISNLQATFSVHLVSNKTYKLVFWADKSGENQTDLHYNTTDLSNVSFAVDDKYLGNDDSRDAFFATETIVADQAKTVSVDLKRPFGQLNVKTLDMKEIVAANQSLVPNKVAIEFASVPTGINLLTGKLTEARSAVSYVESVALANNDNNVGELTFDYVFAPAGVEQYLADFSMSFYDASGVKVAADYMFTSIPIQRNYRTMVSGNLLTKKTDITVNMAPDFIEDNIEIDVDRVKTTEEANDAFANGSTAVEILEAPTTETALILPSTAAGVYLAMPATTAPITVEYAADVADNQKPATLTLSGTFEDLTINTPNTTTTIAGSYTNVCATTANNTLIISENSTVGNLKVEQGNVEVYGKLENLESKPSGSTITLHVATVESLKAFAERLNGGNTKIYDRVVLESDIDFGGAEFSITKADNVVFDGQGHKILNYKVEKNTQSAGLFCDVISVTVKNLTLENANVKAIDDGAGNAYAGALLGRTYGTIIGCSECKPVVEICGTYSLR